MADPRPGPIPLQCLNNRSCDAAFSGLVLSEQDWEGNQDDQPGKAEKRHPVGMSRGEPAAADKDAGDKPHDGRGDGAAVPHADSSTMSAGRLWPWGSLSIRIGLIGGNQGIEIPDSPRHTGDQGFCRRIQGLGNCHGQPRAQHLAFRCLDKADE
jgi:hypothetical protein